MGVEVSGRRRLGPAPALPSSPGIGSSVYYGLWHGTSVASTDEMDGQMAASVGVERPVSTFRRGYSGSGHPATFAASTVADALTYAAATSSGRFGAMLNTKFTDWPGLASGAYDSVIAGFYNSWPENIYGVVTINHEPENDGPTPANRTNPTYVAWAEANGPVYCTGVRRYIDVAAPIIRARGLDLKVGGCLMDFSWDVIEGTQRVVDWRWWNGLAAANINQVDFGIDAYVKTVNGTPPVGYTLVPRLNECLAAARGAGIKSFSLYETALDRRERFNGNNLVGNDATLADWIPGYATFLESVPEVRLVCWFHTPGGPASDQAYLAGPAIPAWATVCMEGKRP